MVTTGWEFVGTGSAYYFLQVTWNDGTEYTSNPIRSLSEAIALEESALAMWPDATTEIDRRFI